MHEETLHRDEKDKYKYKFNINHMNNKPYEHNKVDYVKLLYFYVKYCKIFLHCCRIVSFCITFYAYVIALKLEYHKLAIINYS